MFRKLSIEKNNSVKIFQNNTVDSITKTNPIQAGLVYGFVWLGLLLFHSLNSNIGIKEAIGVYLLALISWTLFEYVIHRFVFHITSEGARIKKIKRLIHGIHHEYPRDIERLIMPPLPGMAIVLFLFILFWALMGEYCYVFLAGFINGWAIYVSIHYVVHAYKPIPGIKILWSHHAKHHFHNENKAFGVSSPLWDYVFGTMPD